MALVRVNVVPPVRKGPPQLASAWPEPSVAFAVSADVGPPNTEIEWEIDAGVRLLPDSLKLKLSKVLPVGNAWVALKEIDPPGAELFDASRLNDWKHGGGGGGAGEGHVFPLL